MVFIEYSSERCYIDTHTTLHSSNLFKRHFSRGIFPSIASELACRTRHDLPNDAPCVYAEMKQGSRPSLASGISDWRYPYSLRISQRRRCNKRSIKPSVVPFKPSGMVGGQ